MTVKVITKKRLGLEVFQVIVNGAMVAEFLSAAQANSKAMQFASYLAKKVA